MKRVTSIKLPTRRVDTLEECGWLRSFGWPLNETKAIKNAHPLIVTSLRNV